ncbi:MAG: penicillin-binding protein 2 [Elusimicrobiota bacterium]|nr:penicillin-binding protein 2 [Elusimicrobiota bacterium]
MKLKHRIIILMVCLFVLFAGLGTRLFFIQVVGHKKYNLMAGNMYNLSVTRNMPERGEIVDRNGEKLAVNRHIYSAGINASYATVSSSMVNDLAGATGKSSGYISGLIKKNPARFIWISREIEPEKAENLKKYVEKGLVLTRGNSRLYPASPLASRIIGCVGVDNQGLSGLEFNFDKEIKGPRTTRRFSRDARGNLISLDFSSMSGQPAAIELTIDINLQHIAYEELKRGYEKYNPEWGIAIIQDPYSGEILAMAEYPGYDTNRGLIDGKTNLQNKAISHIFEPGSTFKVVTAAAALQENLVTTNEMIDCEGGVYMVGGFPVRDYEPYDEISFTDTMVHSSNIGLSKIGERLGSKLLYKYARDFGFGNFTGIRLPGEVRGILRKPDRWSGTSLSRISFGQEIGVSALQLSGMFSAIANGGVLYEPRIIKSIKKGGSRRDYEPLPIRRVISKEVAAELNSILREVVSRGSGVRAQVEGYSAAGKTGTAQKFNTETFTYAKDKYVALFGGFVPADDPKYTITVIFNEPDKRLYWGGYVAAPVFSRISEAVLSYSNIPPDKAM